MAVGGFVAGGLVGYFRFDHGVRSAIGLGLLIAVTLGIFGWRMVSDPQRVADLKRQRADDTWAKEGFRPIAISAALLAVAAIAGFATGSVAVFIAVFATGLLLRIVLGAARR